MATLRSTGPASQASAAGGSLEGKPAPAFNLTADDGSSVSLDDLAGKKVVLYFYPKDNTPGCTRQAQAFQESLVALQAGDAVVLGVSRDSTTSHSAFKKKFALRFSLLTDADATVHRAFGAWGRKVLYGKEIAGVIRTTVIIDRAGLVAKVFSGVKVDGHVEQVKAALAAIP